MRVALVHSYYTAANPSGENIAVDLQRSALESAGIDVHLVSCSTDQLEKHSNYRIRTAVGVATGGGENPLPELQRIRPDIVHVHNLFPNYGTRWLTEWTGPIVTTIHNFRPMCASGILARDGVDCFECPPLRFPWPALRYRCYRNSLLSTAPVALMTRDGGRRSPVLTRPDRVVLLSDRARDVYLRASFAKPDLLRVIPNFVATSPEMPCVPPTKPWAFVGRLSQQKGILSLLDAWPHDEPLNIYGDGELRSEVEARCAGQVQFIGPLPHKELLMNLPGHRGLVFASLSAEALPTVYLEALAAGLPVLAHHGNSAADDVKSAETGIVFNAFSELTEATSRLLADRVKYSRRAWIHHGERYSEVAWIQAILSMYNELTDSA